MTLLLPGLGWNVPTTDASALKVSVQVGALPLHAPDQPLKFELPLAAAESVTSVPSGCLVLQLAPAQATGRPPTLALSVPVPVPPLE